MSRHNTKIKKGESQLEDKTSILMLLYCSRFRRRYMGAAGPTSLLPPWFDNPTDIWWTEQITNEPLLSYSLI